MNGYTHYCKHMRSKVKRLSPSFGGAARFIPRNIEKGWQNDILSYISRKKAARGGKASRNSL